LPATQVAAGNLIFNNLGNNHSCGKVKLVPEIADPSSDAVMT